MTLKNICAGFRITGIHPSNRKAIKNQQFSEYQPEAFIKSTGLKFIPIMSPSCLKTVNYR